MRLKTYELTMFALLGTILFCSKILMEFLPNVHFLAVLTVTYTIVFRAKALIPIYIYVLLNGIYAGFAPWWVPYLYLWTLLWGGAMLLPKKMPKKIAVPVYMTLCGLHGILFGTLYAPVQALFFGMNWQGMLAWIAAGFPWDAIHGLSNFCAGVLVLPLATLLRTISQRTVYR